MSIAKNLRRKQIILNPTNEDKHSDGNSEQLIIKIVFCCTILNDRENDKSNSKYQLSHFLHWTTDFQCRQFLPYSE